jgi:hypothetical protein
LYVVVVVVVVVIAVVVVTRILEAYVNVKEM